MSWIWWKSSDFLEKTLFRKRCILRTRCILRLLKTFLKMIQSGKKWLKNWFLGENCQVLSKLKKQGPKIECRIDLFLTVFWVFEKTCFLLKNRNMSILSKWRFYGFNQYSYFVFFSKNTQNLEKMTFLASTFQKLIKTDKKCSCGS